MHRGIGTASTTGDEEATMGAEGAEYDIIVDELDEETCWRLLSQAGFGRVGFVHGDEVMVLPVNSAISAERVVFRTADDAMLAAAGDGSIVAFEADHTDRMVESGWSVLVRGRMWDVTDRPETETWHELTVRPWAPGARSRWMSIEPTAITGRRIHRQRKLQRGRDAPSVSSD
jgi:nitroimidazol reductase NimA-like FMN-containing flavoprotein (pyridoxamine 5'-phosphate oxidase superfamily)